MPYRDRRALHSAEGVSLNLAAMLDMAFQLLTFFILTFRLAPVEGQLALRLPPARPAIDNNAPVSNPVEPPPASVIEPVRSLVITALGNDSGQLTQLAVGDHHFGANVRRLEAKVHGLLAEPGTPFEQVVIQAGGNLHYAELLQVVDVCARAKLPNGEKLTRLSFVELPAKP